MLTPTPIFSQCSVSCGTGYQRREVICRHIGDTYCRETDKPKTMKNCTTGIPCYSLNGKKQSIVPADEIVVLI